MERDSLGYKLRRKGQVIAYRLLPKTWLSSIYFRIVLKERLHLANPQSFNEKIQWLKLYYFPRNDLVCQCADKYKVREYIEKRGFKDLLVPLLGLWERAEDIDFGMLPEQFVLKCNHGCAYNIICEDRVTWDKRHAVKRLGQWLKEDFGAFNVEPHYSKIKSRRIICEQYLGKELTDYKFFCFHGKPKIVYTAQDLVHARKSRCGYFLPNGDKLCMHREGYSEIQDIDFPKCYEAMLEVAKKLAEDFIFVRVDFFVCGERFYFAELTFTPGAGLIPFCPHESDLEWGRWIDMNKIKLKIEDRG